MGVQSKSRIFAYPEASSEPLWSLREFNGAAAAVVYKHLHLDQTY
jgi:hypothetical protein